MENVKICHTCKRELPATGDYFYRFVHAKDGFKSSCKECQGGSFGSKEKLPTGFKRCSDCKQVLPKTEEYFNKAAGGKYFKAHCIECGKKRCAAWRSTSSKYKAYYTAYSGTEASKAADKKYKETHKDEIKQYKRGYRASHKAQIKAYNKSRRENPETLKKIKQWAQEWKEANAEQVRRYNAEYAKEHTEYFRAAQQKRAAKKRELESTLTLEQWENIKAIFGYKCAYCGKPLTRFTQDHFIPLSKGGNYTAENIIPACKSCNSSKHDKDFYVWYKQYKHYTPEREEKIINYIKQGNTEVNGADCERLTVTVERRE